MVKSLRKVVHEKLSTKVYEGEKELTVEDAKRILGWRGEKDPNEKEAFGTDFKFRDAEGTKVRLTNCETNRAFRRGLALSYANEILRNKWRLNGETITVDVTDCVQSGQHRLVGLVLAEQVRKANPEPWKAYGVRGPLTMPAIVIIGISNEDDVVDTIDLGQKRSLGDVLFRNREFTNDKGQPVEESDQQKLSNTLAGAARVVWLCLGGKNVSDSPKFVHSEALDLIEKHPKLKDAVDHVFSEDAGVEKQIRSGLSLGYAAGLMYLMGTSKTDGKKFDLGEAEIDVSLWEKAEEFWTLFASGADLKKGDPILVLKNFLKGAAAGSGHQRDELIAAVKLAWNAWIEGKKLEGSKDLKPGTEKDEKGKPRLKPVYMGGLDMFREPKPKPEKPKTEKKPKAKKGPKVKGPKAKGPKAKGPAAKKDVSYQFKEGDIVHCLAKGKGEVMYEARVKSISADGKVTVAQDSAPKDEYELNPEEGDQVELDAKNIKPAA